MSSLVFYIVLSGHQARRCNEKSVPVHHNVEGGRRLWWTTLRRCVHSCTYAEEKKRSGGEYSLARSVSKNTQLRNIAEVTRKLRWSHRIGSDLLHHHC